MGALTHGVGVHGHVLLGTHYARAQQSGINTPATGRDSLPSCYLCCLCADLSKLLLEVNNFGVNKGLHTQGATGKWTEGGNEDTDALVWISTGHVKSQCLCQNSGSMSPLGKQQAACMEQGCGCASGERGCRLGKF